MTPAELNALADDHERKGVDYARRLVSNIHDDRKDTQKAANHFSIAAALRALAERMNDEG